MFSRITLVNSMILFNQKVHTLLTKNSDFDHKTPDFAQSYISSCLCSLYSYHIISLRCRLKRFIKIKLKSQLYKGVNIQFSLRVVSYNIYG